MSTITDYTSDQGFAATIPDQYLESFKSFQADQISYIGTFSVTARPQNCDWFYVEPDQIVTTQQQ